MLYFIFKVLTYAMVIVLALGVFNLIVTMIAMFLSFMGFHRFDSLWEWISSGSEDDYYGG